MSSAIEFHETVAPPKDFMELIVIGGRSNSAIRAAGNLVNVFTLAGVIQTATVASGVSAYGVLMLVGVLAACSTQLSPRQAAFFVAAQSLKNQNTIPTASAIARECTTILPGLPVSTADVLAVADELLKMGVKLDIREPPNNVIYHEEWTITVPGF